MENRRWPHNIIVVFIITVSRFVTHIFRYADSRRNQENVMLLQLCYLNKTTTTGCLHTKQNKSNREKYKGCE